MSKKEKKQKGIPTGGKNRKDYRRRKRGKRRTPKGNSKRKRGFANCNRKTTDKFWSCGAIINNQGDETVLFGLCYECYCAARPAGCQRRNEASASQDFICDVEYRSSL